MKASELGGKMLSAVFMGDLEVAVEVDGKVYSLAEDFRVQGNKLVLSTETPKEPKGGPAPVTGTPVQGSVHFSQDPSDGWNSQGIPPRPIRDDPRA